MAIAKPTICGDGYTFRRQAVSITEVQLSKQPWEVLPYKIQRVDLSIPTPDSVPSGTYVEDEHGWVFRIERLSLSGISPTNDLLFPEAIRDYARQGVWEDVVVERRKGRYAMLNGHQRLAAAKRMWLGQ